MILKDLLNPQLFRRVAVVGRCNGEMLIENHSLFEQTDDGYFVLRGTYRDIYFNLSEEIQPYGEALGGGFRVKCTDETIYRLIFFTLPPLT